MQRLWLAASPPELCRHGGCTMAHLPALACCLLAESSLMLLSQAGPALLTQDKMAPAAGTLADEDFSPFPPGRTYSQAAMSQVMAQPPEGMLAEHIALYAVYGCRNEYHAAAAAAAAAAASVRQAGHWCQALLFHWCSPVKAFSQELQHSACQLPAGCKCTHPGAGLQAEAGPAHQEAPHSGRMVQPQQAAKRRRKLPASLTGAPPQPVAKREVGACSVSSNGWTRTGIQKGERAKLAHGLICRCCGRSGPAAAGRSGQAQAEAGWLMQARRAPAAAALSCSCRALPLPDL